MTIVENKYYRLSKSTWGGIAFLKWQPESLLMTNDGFREHCDLLNNFLNADTVRMLFIDAMDFKANKNSCLAGELKYIRHAGELKWVLYVPGDNNMGKLLQNAELTVNYRVLGCSSQKELMELYEKLTDR